MMSSKTFDTSEAYAFNATNLNAFKIIIKVELQIRDAEMISRPEVARVKYNVQNPIVDRPPLSLCCIHFHQLGSSSPQPGPSTFT